MRIFGSEGQTTSAQYLDTGLPT